MGKNNIGEMLAELILTNIKIWHEDTKLRNGVNLRPIDIVMLGSKGRGLNADRSTLKYLINHAFNDDLFDDRKVNYSKGGQDSQCSDTQSQT
jgi:hypothetical protein